VDTVGTRWYTLAEAAPILGVSVDTVRRRLKRGLIEGRQVHTQHGPTWEVTLGTASTEHEDAAEGAAQPAQGTQGVAEDEAGAGLVQLVALVDRLQQENRTLAGQVGFLTAQLGAAEDRLAIAAAPIRLQEAQPGPESAPASIGPPGPFSRAWWPWLVILAVVGAGVLLAWPR